MKSLTKLKSVGSVPLRVCSRTLGSDHALARVAPKSEPPAIIPYDEATVPKHYNEPVKMMASEAMVETFVRQKVNTVFGIVGSAFMDALDLFPEAGIRFLAVQHEQNAVHMADGYSRITGKHGVCTAQNGPGISNFVTGVAAAYWAHSPVVVMTPEAGTLTKGHGGFQEVDQLPLFEPITKYQGHVNNPARMAEITNRAFDIAMSERGPTQINVPRDYFYHEGLYQIPTPSVPEKAAGGPKSIKAAVDLIRHAKNPVILAGGGVTMAGAEDEVAELAALLSAPIAVTYLHNDAVPADNPLYAGPLGYQGSQAAMYSLRDADVVIALGTRLSPFGTLPQYGEDYYPTKAKVIQVEADARRIGTSKKVDVGICGDVKLAAKEMTEALRAGGPIASDENKTERIIKFTELKDAWRKKLDDITYANVEACTDRIRPRHALRALERGLVPDSIVSTDIGNICSVSNSYLKFNHKGPSMLAAMTFGNCGYSFPAAMGAKVAAPHRNCVAYVGDGAWGMQLNEVMTCIREDVPTTAVVFNNGQWGAEKKNQVLWFGDRYVGSQLDNPWSYAEIARSMYAEGITCTHVDQVTDALSQATKNQEEGKTTVIEVMVTKELGDPFRRDAMKLPVRHLEKYKNTCQYSESATGQPTDL
ncbi:hypothetical protein ACHWQZ_G001664 [Mnemiopsis leidyi]